MSKRNTKRASKRLGDQANDIELHDTCDVPIKPKETPSSPNNVPREDRAAALHTFTSDVDQQKMVADIKSETATLREGPFLK